MPHQFYGDVTIDGVAAADGLTVEAKIDGVVYASGVTDAGKYGYSTPLFKVLADDPDVVGIEGGVAGDTVSFYVDGILATPTYTFAYGISTSLNLVATGAVAPPENVAPVADAGGPYSALTDVAINFDGSDSTDSDGTIASYAWVFGDGGTGTGVSPSHTYTTAGTYTVALTVTDDDAATDSDTAIATITDPDDDDDDDDVVPGEGFSIDYVSADTVDYDDELSVVGSGVTAGADVSVYWDLLTSDGLLNTTEGNPNGSFDLTIDIPSDLAGNHYLWARDESTG
ncbi:hypothetical protein LCGC14_2511430, partial [marine sediment metagenome]